VLGLLCSLFGASSLLGFYFLPTGEAVQQMDALVKSYRSAAPDSRRLATQATFELFRGSPTFGWGAGSFRFVFPIYQQYYPIIYMEGDQRLYWEHAHDDYAELLAELGIVGSSMLVVGAVYYLVTLLRLHFWENPFSLLLFGGCMITLIHCAGDFNFFNPAILITWCIFWPGMIRWLEVKKFGE
jgi:O-antigen ligase